MKYQEKINNVSTVAIAAALFAVPAMLIFEQPNLSTCLVTLVIVLGIVFSAGISYRWIVGVLAVTIPMVGTCVYLLLHGLIPFIKEYQAGRILAWFYPDRYGEARYQQNNSIIAIGSGQLKGKGLFNTTIASVKNGNFLSEEQTDFIFAVIGEELGFIGCVIVIILFLLIVYECLMMAARAKDLAGRLICTGMATLIAFQGFANIAVATGIFPNTGLPLPFISYGSSSLISIFIGMGLVLNAGLQREYHDIIDPRRVIDMTIGLIAHDAKKKLMQNFCIAYRGILSKHTLYATGTTGRLIEEVANLNIHKYLAGHLGGTQQMAARSNTTRWIWLFFCVIL